MSYPSGLKLFWFSLLVVGLFVSACGEEREPAPTLAQKATVPDLPPTAVQVPTLPPTSTPATPTPTPTIVSDPPTPAPPTATPEPQLYSVQSGDTLLGIALAFDIDFDTLVQINGINADDILAIGQVLKIPAADEIPQKAQPTIPKMSAISRCPRILCRQGIAGPL